MDVKMIRSIQPTSALPVTRNMPYHTASVPSRNQPRNMTGIYLGLEGNIKPPQNRTIMPFVKNRAGMSPKVRTTAEDRRYKKVELLRIKEETRGFRGQTVKKQRQLRDEYMKENVKPKSSKARQWGPAKSANPTKFEDIIRQNPRNYTNVINNGVSRSENLQGFMSFDDHYTYEMANMLLPDALIEEVQRIAGEREDLLGLEECYKKVCKGNAESLHSLLPLRKGSGRSDSFSTGFTVRSYRNPNKAELLADFEVQPLVHTRPKTVPATQLQRQPHVPAPYFFKYYNKPKTAGHRSGKSPSSQFEEQMNSGDSGDKIFGANGSGAISRSIRQGRTSAWSEDDLNNRIVRRGTPRTDTPLKDNTESRHIHIPMRNDSVLTNAEPLEIRAEGYQNNSDDKTPLTDRTTNGDPPNTSRSTDQSSTRNGEPAEAKSPKKSSIKAEKKEKLEERRSQRDMDGRERELGDNTIRLDLETEDGKKQEIILDDRESEKENINKARESEAIVASHQADAEERRKQFEQILHEHEEIVTAITHQSSTEGSVYSGSSAAANQSSASSDWTYAANWKTTQDSHSGYHRTRYRATRSKDIDVSPLLDVLKRIDDIDTSIGGRRKTKLNESDSEHSSLFRNLDMRENTDLEKKLTGSENFPSPRWPSSSTDDENEFGDDVQWPSSKEDDDSDTVKDALRDKRQNKKPNTGENMHVSAPVIGRHNTCTDLRSDLDTMDGISNFSSEEEYDEMFLNKDGLVGGNNNGAEDETKEDLYTGDEDESSEEDTTDDVFSQSSDEDYNEEDSSSEGKDLEPVRSNYSGKESNVHTPATGRADHYRASIDSFEKLCDDLDIANSDSEGSEFSWKAREDDSVPQTSREYFNKDKYVHLSKSSTPSQFENDSVITTPLAKPSKLFNNCTRSAPVTRKSSEVTLYGDLRNQDKTSSREIKKPISVNKISATNSVNETSHSKTKTVKSPETGKQESGVSGISGSCGVSVAALRAAMEREIARANAN